MKRKRFSEEKIIGVLKEHVAGAKADKICRRHGINRAALYAWRKKRALSAIGPGAMVRAAWKYRRASGCESWKQRTQS